MTDPHRVWQSRTGSPRCWFCEESAVRRVVLGAKVAPTEAPTALGRLGPSGARSWSCGQCVCQNGGLSRSVSHGRGAGSPSASPPGHALGVRCWEARLSGGQQGQRREAAPSVQPGRTPSSPSRPTGSLQMGQSPEERVPFRCLCLSCVCFCSCCWRC